jgi:hypothetical protein
MPCTITQADLGTLFEEVDADLAADFIEAATEVVLGYTDVQAAAAESIKACGIDPCRMIKLLAQHMLATTPGAGVSGSTGTITSERVDAVAVSYATANSNSGLWSGSSFGTMFSFQLARLEKCRANRRGLPFAVGPSGAFHG